MAEQDTSRRVAHTPASTSDPTIRSASDSGGRSASDHPPRTEANEASKAAADQTRSEAERGDTHASEEPGRPAVAPHALTPAVWAAWSDDQLLQLRLCDLGLTIEGTELDARIAQIAGELETRGVAFRPHYWLSDEWFTPDGVPGIAIPFYLAHPRLAKLELAQMLEVEGGDPAWCMRILRHEVGHAIDNAYDLRRRPTRRRLFGMPATPYPEYYTPKPYSKSFVQHLDHWYAQSHPDEDFAETFAVWLDPHAMWAQRYAGWPAMRKLEYMDALMRQIRKRRPPVTSKRRVDPLAKLKKTLAEHYRHKREHYGLDHPDFYESDLRNLFSDSPGYAKHPHAARFLRRIRKEVRSTVASYTDSYQYTIDQLIEKIIERCRELNLHLTDSEEATKLDFMVFLTVQTMNYLHSGRHRVAL
jgi:hypothetical protein